MAKAGNLGGDLLWPARHEVVVAVTALGRVDKVPEGSSKVAATSTRRRLMGFSLGGPFVYLLPKAGFEFDPLWGAILLPLYTFLTPILDSSYTEAKSG